MKDEIMNPPNNEYKDKKAWTKANFSSHYKMKKVLKIILSLESTLNQEVTSLE